MDDVDAWLPSDDDWETEDKNMDCGRARVKAEPGAEGELIKGERIAIVVLEGCIRC